MNDDADRVWCDGLRPQLAVAARSYVTLHGAAFTRDAGGDRPDGVKIGQLRNLLNANATAGSLAVLQNLLRYQIGRGRRGWSHADSGHALLKLLTTEVGDPVAAHAKETGPRRWQLETTLAGTLLGFLVREVTYEISGLAKERKS